MVKNSRDMWNRGLVEKRELGVGFLINKDLDENIEEFNSNEDRVAGLVNQLNKRCKLKVVQAYVPTSTRDDELMECLYGRMESAMSKLQTVYLNMAYFSAKVD